MSIRDIPAPEGFETSKQAGEDHGRRQPSLSAAHSLALELTERLHTDQNEHPMRTDFERQKGMALAMALLISITIFGICGAYFTLSIGGCENSSRELSNVQARKAADDGLNLSLAEIKSLADPGGDGLGALTATAPDGRTITVSVNRVSLTRIRDPLGRRPHPRTRGCRRGRGALPLAAGRLQPQGRHLHPGTDHHDRRHHDRRP